MSFLRIHWCPDITKRAKELTDRGIATHEAQTVARRQHLKELDAARRLVPEREPAVEEAR